MAEEKIKKGNKGNACSGTETGRCTSNNPATTKPEMKKEGYGRKGRSS